MEPLSVNRASIEPYMNSYAEIARLMNLVVEKVTFKQGSIKALFRSPAGR